ncbi:MAG: hypothetical protein A2Z88_11205 [Omnitrophica WOR_2 bacterium GWA2_47_8]|nr:MAG: hypothetical protein A2Z88_11205 [Omnitrophica WOR_2 bacterium GWA2_47_8]
MLKSPPSRKDALFLCLFTLLITYQPFILHEQIRYWELTIYLPAIQAVFEGLIPYRDFFYLRGPLEIYVPALLMKIFGQSIPVLSYYFYIGTVICYIILTFIARHLYKTRLFLYLAIPVVVALTFPYVYYYDWGGMRYALGLLALACTVFYFKKPRTRLIYLNAFFSAACLLTSVDVGVCSIAGLLSGLVMAKALGTLARKEFRHYLKHYIAGLAVLGGTYIGYLIATGSLAAYLDSTISVATGMTRAFDTPQNNKYPADLTQWILTLFPASKNFQQMTPIYCYLSFMAYTFYLHRRKKLYPFYSALICIAAYGFFLFVVAWRIIQNAHFEMALLPEKLILFFLLEQAFLILREKKGRSPLLSYVFIFSLITLLLSSWLYALTRLNRRFVSFKIARNVLTGKSIDPLKPNPGVPKKRLELATLRGMVVPASDAKEYEDIIGIIQKITKPDEAVLFFPEHGMYNFLTGRIFATRFATVKYVWFNDKWQGQFMRDLKAQKPRIIAVQDPIPESWRNLVLWSDLNLKKFNEIYGYIQENYRVIQKTATFTIYETNPSSR